MTRNTTITAAAALLAAVILGGCHYRLTDRNTGAVYYTTETDGQWSTFPPGQSVVFVDRTGKTVVLIKPKIETISKAEYEAARGPK